MEALEHVHELIPTHMKRSQEIHQISEELMSEHVMRKSMTINTRQAYRRDTSQISQESTRQAHRKSTSQIQQESNPQTQVGEAGEPYSDSSHET
jgi:hypothetical protein